MSRSLSDLSEHFRPLAVELIARAVEAGIQVRIIDTLRTETEQQENLRRGVSWTAKSKHLPDESGKANAIDLGPIECLSLKNWAPLHPAWERLGEIGESVGLTWGGRWKVRDCSHFELKSDQT
jgi:D-alanyl-D-alanine carboxypeptidase